MRASCTKVPPGALELWLVPSVPPSAAPPTWELCSQWIAHQPTAHAHPHAAHDLPAKRKPSLLWRIQRPWTTGHMHRMGYCGVAVCRWRGRGDGRGRGLGGGFRGSLGPTLVSSPSTCSLRMWISTGSKPAFCRMSRRASVSDVGHSRTSASSPACPPARRQNVHTRTHVRADFTPAAGPVEQAARHAPTPRGVLAEFAPLYTVLCYHARARS